MSDDRIAALENRVAVLEALVARLATAPTGGVRQTDTTTDEEPSWLALLEAQMERRRTDPSEPLTRGRKIGQCRK